MEEEIRYIYNYTKKSNWINFYYCIVHCEQLKQQAETAIAFQNPPGSLNKGGTLGRNMTLWQYNNERSSSLPILAFCL